MLHRQRTEFWETAPQYDGLVETWNSLRVAVELSHQNDLTTAQAVLDSAGITIPTGDLGTGCYDERGHRFVVPDFVLAEPSNILDDEVELKPRDSSSTAINKHEIEALEEGEEAEISYTVVTFEDKLIIGQNPNVDNFERYRCCFQGGRKCGRFEKATNGASWINGRSQTISVRQTVERRYPFVKARVGQPHNSSFYT